MEEEKRRSLETWLNKQSEDINYYQQKYSLYRNKLLILEAYKDEYKKISPIRLNDYKFRNENNFKSYEIKP